MNLFDVTRGVDPFNPGMRDRRTRNDGPRDCTAQELRAYLNWLAERDGIAVPDGARYCARGIVIGGTMDRNGAHTGGTVILAMPGYGQSQTVMYELLDDAGNVVKSFPLPADKSGKLPMTAKQVREWSGLAPQRKARAKAAPKVPSTPIAAENAPEAISAVAAARIAELEAQVRGLVAELEKARAPSSGDAGARQAETMGGIEGIHDGGTNQAIPTTPIVGVCDDAYIDRYDWSIEAKRGRRANAIPALTITNLTGGFDGCKAFARSSVAAQATSIRTGDRKAFLATPHARYVRRRKQIFARNPLPEMEQAICREASIHGEDKRLWGHMPARLGNASGPSCNLVHGPWLLAGSDGSSQPRSRQQSAYQFARREPRNKRQKFQNEPPQ